MIILLFMASKKEVGTFLIVFLFLFLLWCACLATARLCQYAFTKVLVANTDCLWRMLFWTNFELQNFGHPVLFADAPYYKSSMTFYCLAVIALISSFYFYKVRKNSKISLQVFHILAAYTNRSYSSNVFWNQIIWHSLIYQTIYHSPSFLQLLSHLVINVAIIFCIRIFLHIFWANTKSYLLNKTKRHRLVP